MDGLWTLPYRPSAHYNGDPALLYEYENLPIGAPKPMGKVGFRIMHIYITDPVQEVERLICKLRNETRELRRGPYNPGTWSRRAKTLLSLRYPELAAGDAWKSFQLLDEIELRQGSALAEKVESSIMKITRVRSDLAIIRKLRLRLISRFCRALFLANCLDECIKLLDRAVQHGYLFKHINNFSRLVHQAHRAETDYHVSQSVRAENDDLDIMEERTSGDVKVVLYPWLPAKYKQRSPATVNALHEQISTASSRKCGVAHSSIRDEIPLPGEPATDQDVLGIFSRKYLSDARHLFDDSTIFHGTNNLNSTCLGCGAGLSGDPVFEFCMCSRSQGCSLPYCSNLCRSKTGASFYDNVGSHKITAVLRDYVSQPASPDRLAYDNLFSKILVSLSRKPGKHPLSASPFSQLKVQTAASRTMLFNFSNDIVKPMKALRRLGIDIFANHNFDTWVLTTLHARISNNIRHYEDSDSGIYTIGLNTSYALFNHSCDPDVEIRRNASCPSTIHIQTRRPVQKFQELYISYLDVEDLDLPYKERWEKLKDWTGESCQCKRCKEEAATEEQEQVQTDRGGARQAPLPVTPRASPPSAPASMDEASVRSTPSTPTTIIGRWSPAANLSPSKLDVQRLNISSTSPSDKYKKQYRITKKSPDKIGSFSARVKLSTNLSPSRNR